MADWLESFYPMRLHVLVRFGMWDELIARPLPADPDLYCVTTALTHYAKGVAYAATRRAWPRRRRERERLLAARSRGCPRSRYLFNNTALDILAIAQAMLDGEIAYRRGRLRRRPGRTCAAPSSSTTPCPTTSRGGGCNRRATLTARCCSSRARWRRRRRCTRADLGLDATLPRACQHPNNVWSLHGYHECLHRLGRCEEADALAPALDRALALADVPIRSSCFCRTEIAA